MKPLSVDAVHTACDRYGPGRLPNAENHAVGAGYAGASAAVCAAVVYAIVAFTIDSVGLVASPAANVAVATLALPFFAAGAFVAGVVGWRILQPRSPVHGVVAGSLGVVCTYAVVLVLFGVPVTTLEALSGADPLRAAVFSWGVVYFAVLETWWVALPLGTFSGFVYVTVVSRTA